MNYDITPSQRRRFVNMVMKYDGEMGPEDAENAALADLGITEPEHRFILRGELAPTDDNTKWLSVGQLQEVTGRAAGELSSWAARQCPSRLYNGRLWIAHEVIDGIQAVNATLIKSEKPKATGLPVRRLNRSEYMLFAELAAHLHITYATLTRRRAELLQGLRCSEYLVNNQHVYLKSDVDAWLRTEQARKVYGAPFPGELSLAGISYRLRAAAAAAGVSQHAFRRRLFIRPEPCRVTFSGMRFYDEAEVKARLHEAVSNAS